MAMAQMILAKRLTTQTFVADPYQEDWSGPALLTSGRGGLRVLFRPSERGGACQEAWCSRAFLTSGLAKTILFVRESALLANGSGGGRFPCRRQPAKEHKVSFRSPQGHTDKVVCSVPSRTGFDNAKEEYAFARTCN